MAEDSGARPAQSDDLGMLATGAGIAFAGRLLGRALDIGRQALLARLLSGSDFGLYALAITVLRFAIQIAVFGLNVGVVRFGVLYRDEPRRFGAALQAGLLLALAAGAVVAGLLLATAHPLSESVFRQPALAYALGWFALAVPVAVVLQIAAAATTLTQSVVYSVALDQIIQPALYLLLVVGLIMGIGALPLDAALLSAPLSYLICAVLALWVLARLFPMLLRAGSGAAGGLLPMLRFSAPVAAASVFLWSSPLVDRLLVGLFRPLEEAGIYLVVAQLATLFTLIGTAIGSIQSPLVARLLKEGDRAHLEQVCQFAVRVGLLLAGPALLALVFGAGDVLALLFGEAFRAGGPALLVLALASLIRVLSDRAIELLVMAGYNRRWLALSTAAFILNIVLDLALIPPLGLMGAAFGTGIVNLFLFTALGVTAWRRTQVRFVGPAHAWFLLAALAGVVAGLPATLLGSPLARVSLFALLATVAFAAFAWRFAFPADQRRLLVTMMRDRTQGARHS